MSEPRDGSQGGGPGDPRRPSGPLESLFQEAVRRATGLGISGLASTEEAVRRAFQERAPKEWLRFVSEQGDGLRTEIAERIGAEVAAFLRSPELEGKLRGLLAQYEVSVTVQLRADPRTPAPEPKVEIKRRED
jgi:hypothetical protein